MNLCSDDHEEICYESRSCPLCDIVSNHKTGIEKMEEDYIKLENENITLTEKINEYEEIHKEIKIHYPEFCI